MATTREPFEPAAGVSTQIGYYLAALEYTRGQLRGGVSGLTSAQIAARLQPEANSIGQLIIHTAEAELWWIQFVVGGKSRQEFDSRELFHITEDENYAERGHTAEFCLTHLDAIGKSTASTLAEFEDADLERFFGWEHKGGKRIEMTLRGILTHLIDHQATHKGQILMLKRLMNRAV